MSALRNEIRFTPAFHNVTERGSFRNAFAYDESQASGKR